MKTSSCEFRIPFHCIPSQLVLNQSCAFAAFLLSYSTFTHLSYLSLLEPLTPARCQALCTLGTLTTVLHIQKYPHAIPTNLSASFTPLNFVHITHSFLGVTRDLHTSPDHGWRVNCAQARYCVTAYKNYNKYTANCSSLSTYRTFSGSS